MRFRFSHLIAGALAILAAFSTPTPASAQQASEGIAAVVNSEAISAYDLRNRLDLVITTSNLPDQPQVRQRILPQVLRNLIDEHLKLQEAKRLGIKISKDDIQQRIHDIEQRNNMPPGGMSNFLANSGIDKATLEYQIRADLAWADVIRKIYGPQVSISDSEIDNAIAKIDENAGKPEYRVYEIFLPIDDPKNERDVTQLAHRLVQQLHQGASFTALARNFSQKPSAAQGGDLGWVRPQELGEKLAPVVKQMQPGQLAGPIRTDDGFHILLLRDQRTAPSMSGPDDSGVKVSLYQLHLGVAKNASPADVADAKARAKKLAASAKTCTQFKQVAAKNGSSLSGDLGTVQLSNLPDNLRNQVGGLAKNQTTEPMRTADGVIVIMVCDRTGGKSAKDAAQERRARVRAQLLNERLTARAHQHLRDLRRAAFIDVRM